MLISLHSHTIDLRISFPANTGELLTRLFKRVCIDNIFGFTDDYAKVTYGMRYTLQLIRKDDNDALFRTAAAGAGKGGIV